MFDLAAGLVDLGVEPQQRVAIASTTRIEWILADLAIMCAGGATTTVYPTTTAPDVAYILGDSESVVLFAEDAEQADEGPGRATCRTCGPSCCSTAPTPRPATCRC